MKRKDYLIVALAPLTVLLISLIAMRFTREVNWTWSDFAVMWVVLSVPTLLFRLMVTRPWAGLPYRLGAGLGVVTGFLMAWVSLAVQIIGHENPANLLYFFVILIGLIGVALARFHPAGMAKAAFVTAAATFLVPIVAYLGWPDDFSPGVPQVFLLNGCFVLMFALSGLLFRRAANQPIGSGSTASV
jgi:hypothetical protein